MSACVHCLVSGRVQGVFYRAETQAQASLLDLRGWVRNLPDGRVELVACGEPDDLKQLQDWLQAGPSQARVMHVECAPTTADDFGEDFEVRY